MEYSDVKNWMFGIMHRLKRREGRREYKKEEKSEGWTKYC
jgi:hypothetical protein